MVVLVGNNRGQTTFLLDKSSLGGGHANTSVELRVDWDEKEGQPLFPLYVLVVCKNNGIFAT